MTPQPGIDNNLVLVTGATGYVGGRLVPRLLENGYRVRVLVRDPRRLQGRPWLEAVEVVQGDVLDPETLPAALQDVQTAYYLIHSMEGKADFVERDRNGGRHFGLAAKAANVERIIYLGGLGNPEDELSKHLRSRQLSGDALRQGGVPVTEFRAAIIVGSGSISFEMIRYLTERIPMMICPRWVFTHIQPIAIHDVLTYLLAAIQYPESSAEVIEIGGADVLTYGEMMLGYAAERGLKRRLIAVPVLTPHLSSYWVHWMTPIPAPIARPLIEGLRNEVVVRNDSARRIFPDIHPMGYQEAVHLALNKLDNGEVETIWSDALISSRGDVPPVYLAHEQGLIIERREIEVKAPPEAVYRLFSSLGGKRGWLALNAAWQLRGALDRLLGGVGMRRGRRSANEVRVGDAIDFWRVEAIEPNHLLRLRAEMKVPGRAWLQFESRPQSNGRTKLVQTAFFEPKGLMGLLYWYLLYPIHAWIFGAMVHEIARQTEESLQEVLNIKVQPYK
jgi:uncharacterized protein YbjT (DUF2867 family)/uncharacterized protein YndB with AHSA1/START domain